MTVYEMITERILSRIEKAEQTGERFYWVKPWTGGAKCAASYTTGKAYNGINQVMLQNGEFITFKALQEYKGTLTEEEAEKVKIKKGCHKVPIFYFGKVENKREEGEESEPDEKTGKEHWFMRYYQAFDIEDIEGLPSHYPAEHYDHTPTENSKVLDEYINAYARSEGLKIDYVKDGGRCFYRPSQHMVRVPESDGFKSLYGYYSSVLHEICHSTSKGLDRKLGSGFGTQSYSREELVAQIGSQMLLSRFGIVPDNEQEEDSDIAYIKGWASYLKDNKTEIVKASNAAQKAVEYFVEVAERQMLREQEKATEQKEVSVER